MKKYEILSPDNLPIDFENRQYKSKKEVLIAIKNFVKKYEFQGYYSSNFNRIPLDELPYHLQIIKI